METLDDNMDAKILVVNERALKLLQGSSVWKKISSVIAGLTGGAGLFISFMVIQHSYNTPDKLAGGTILIASAMGVILSVYAFRMGNSLSRLGKNATIGEIENYASLHNLFWKMLGITAIVCASLVGWLFLALFFFQPSYNDF
jgi:hypothetical protein